MAMRRTSARPRIARRHLGQRTDGLRHAQVAEHADRLAPHAGVPVLQGFHRGCEGFRHAQCPDRTKGQHAHLARVALQEWQQRRGRCALLQFGQHGARRGPDIGVGIEQHRRQRRHHLGFFVAFERAHRFGPHRRVRIGQARQQQRHDVVLIAVRQVDHGKAPDFWVCTAEALGDGTGLDNHRPAPQRSR
jgi:hypothetical protein